MSLLTDRGCLISFIGLRIRGIWFWTLVVAESELADPLLAACSTYSRSDMPACCILTGSALPGTEMCHSEDSGIGLGATARLSPGPRSGVKAGLLLSLASLDVRPDCNEILEAELLEQTSSLGVQM